MIILSWKLWDYVESSNDSKRKVAKCRKEKSGKSKRGKEKKSKKEQRKEKSSEFLSLYMRL